MCMKLHGGAHNSGTKYHYKYHQIPGPPESDSSPKAV